jgi:hypothetical protein
VVVALVEVVVQHVAGGPLAEALTVLHRLTDVQSAVEKLGVNSRTAAAAKLHASS